MEVDDRHNDKLIVEDHSDTQGKIHVPGEPWSQKLAPDPAYDSTDHRDGERRRRRGRRAGLSTTSLCLAISLALALVLAAVAAGVAGSIAAKRQRSLDT